MDILAPDARATAARALAPRADRATRHGEPALGYKRIVGELKGLGISVSATSVRKVLLEAGLQPAPQRTHSSWRTFLRAQAASTLACDFLTVGTIFLQRIYFLFFISLATRRIEYVACSSHPDGRWLTQQARNLAMEFADEQPFRFLIHDRDTKFSRAFDEVNRAEGIKVIRTPVQAPNANAFAERWVRTVRADCLDRILILGRRHLEHVLRVYRRQRALLTHWAPDLGASVESLVGPGMGDADRREPSFRVAAHPLPVEAASLAAAPKRPVPESHDLGSEGLYLVDVAGHGVVGEMTSHYAREPASLCFEGPMASSHQQGSDLAQRCRHSFRDRLSQQ